MTLQCVAVCCSVLQCVAVCCSVLQCVAVCCSLGISAVPNDMLTVAWERIVEKLNRQQFTTQFTIHNDYAMTIFTMSDECIYCIN